MTQNYQDVEQKAKLEEINILYKPTINKSGSMKYLSKHNIYYLSWWLTKSHIDIHLPTETQINKIEKTRRKNKQCDIVILPGRKLSLEHNTLNKNMVSCLLLFSDYDNMCLDQFAKYRSVHLKVRHFSTNLINYRAKTKNPNLSTNRE